MLHVSGCQQHLKCQVGGNRPNRIQTDTLHSWRTKFVLAHQQTAHLLHVAACQPTAVNNGVEHCTWSWLQAQVVLGVATCSLSLCVPCTNPCMPIAASAVVVVAPGQKYHSIVLRPQEPVSDTCIFTAFRTADGRYAPTPPQHVDATLAMSWQSYICQCVVQAHTSIVVKPRLGAGRQCPGLLDSSYVAAVVPCRSIEPELYPRPDGTVYVCGEPAAVPVPAGGPADVSLEQQSLQVLQVGHSDNNIKVLWVLACNLVAACKCAAAMTDSSAVTACRAPLPCTAGR